MRLKLPDPCFARTAHVHDIDSTFSVSAGKKEVKKIVQVLFTVGNNYSDHIIRLEVCCNKVYDTKENRLCM